MINYEIVTKEHNTMTQTNQTSQRENAKPLEILIGDDMFAFPMDALTVRQAYLKPLQKRLASEYALHIEEAATPEQMIREAQTGRYDVIVTDLDYQTESKVGTEGYQVLDAIASMNLPKKPFVILCTSSDSEQENIQRKLKEGRMNAYLGSKGTAHKFGNLLTYLFSRYSTPQRAPAEGDTPLQEEGGEKE